MALPSLRLNNLIYLDNAATTKPDENLLNEANNYYLSNFYNPSGLYKGGVELQTEINRIREHISLIFGANYNLIFTSCGTESNNMVLNHFSKRGNIVTTLAEHSAIYEKAKDLKNKGVDVRFAKINKDGSVNVEHLLSLIDDNTTLVSVIHVNNETGAINNIEELAKKIKEKSNAVFHSDGVQAFLKVSNKLNYVDLYSISGHKVGAIKGIGALIVKKGLHISPLIFGGGQEKGLRSGTENVFGIKTLALAVEKNQNYLENLKKIERLKNIFIENLTNFCEIISSKNASPYIISLSCVGLKSEIILHMLEESGVIIGTGSACSKNSNSRVLAECGYNEKVLQGVIRISFGFNSSEDDALIAVRELNKSVEKLKKIMRV